MQEETRIRLGELLIERGVITPEQLEVALKKQKEQGGLLGSILLELGFIDEETVFLPIVAGQQDVEYINLKEQQISAEAIAKIPAKFATFYRIIPFDYKNGVLSFKPLMYIANLDLCRPHYRQPYGLL